MRFPYLSIFLGSINLCPGPLAGPPWETPNSTKVWARIPAQTRPPRALACWPAGPDGNYRRAVGLPSGSDPLTNHLAGMLRPWWIAKCLPAFWLKHWGQKRICAREGEREQSASGSIWSVCVLPLDLRSPCILSVILRDIQLHQHLPSHPSR